MTEADGDKNKYERILLVLFVNKQHCRLYCISM